MSIVEKVWKNSLETCEYLDGYENSQSIIQVRCIKHNYEFNTKYENVRRDNRPHYICPKCQKEARKSRVSQNRLTVECAYCGIEFEKAPSKIKQSKSGLFFCCREHKDLAQRCSSGEKFAIIRPEHYGTTSKDYRTKAFEKYEHKCAVCGWCEDERILEVHHIDTNHENNDVNNLMILCPICHRKLTLHYYQLVDNNQLEPLI